MTIVTSEQESAFVEALIRHGMAANDFNLTETAPSAALKTRSLYGWVTVRRTSNSIARTYCVGPDLTWLSWLKRDLASGVFSSIRG